MDRQTDRQRQIDRNSWRDRKTETETQTQTKRVRHPETKA